MTTVTLSLLFAAASVQPVGTPTEVQWSKRATGYRVGESGLKLEAVGPGAVLFEIRGPKELKNQEISVEIRRDGTHVSKNTLKLRKRGKGPKTDPVMAKIGVTVPEGTHTYTIVAPAELAVLATTPRRVPKKLAAADEEELAPAAVAEVSESSDADGSPTAGEGTDASGDSEASADSSSSEETAADAETIAAIGTDASTEEGTDAATPAPDGAADPAASAEASTETSEGTEATPTDGEATAAFAGEGAALGPPETRGMRIAVYNLELEGIETSVGVVVTDSLIAEVRKLDGVSAIGMDEIEDMLSLEAAKQMVGCEAQDSCMAEIAGALGVDGLVTGKLVKAADSHMFNIRRVDQQEAKVVGTFNQRLAAGSGQEFLAVVGPSVEELFPTRTLREGAKRGVDAEVALRLDPPPLPTWSFWATAGVGVAAAIAGSVFALLASSKQSEYNDLASRSIDEDPNDGLPPPKPTVGATLIATGNELSLYSNVTNGLLISGGVFAIAAGIMWLFTDWDGYGDVAASSAY